MTDDLDTTPALDEGQGDALDRLREALATPVAARLDLPAPSDVDLNAATDEAPSTEDKAVAPVEDPALVDGRDVTPMDVAAAHDHGVATVLAALDAGMAYGAARWLRGADRAALQADAAALARELRAQSRRVVIGR